MIFYLKIICVNPRNWSPSASRYLRFFGVYDALVFEFRDEPEVYEQACLDAGGVQIVEQLCPQNDVPYRNIMRIDADLKQVKFYLKIICVHLRDLRAI